MSSKYFKIFFRNSTRLGVTDKPNIEIIKLDNRSFCRCNFLCYFISKLLLKDISKTDQIQPSKGVLTKKCSENMQQIYKRTSMPKCDFNKFFKKNLGRSFLTKTFFINKEFRCFPGNFLKIFREVVF